MAGTDITKVSKAPDTTIMRQGHTTNGQFGSSPSKKAKPNGRPVRDLTVPNAKG